MAKRLLERALKKAGCTIRKPDKGPHTTWCCPCGAHTADIPRHRGDISPGVVKDTMERMKCLPEGWLR